MNYIIMHESTLNYLIDKDCFDIRRHIGGETEKVWISGIEVKKFNCLLPTIMEPEYVFPKNRFIKYQYKDREWCEPLGIGRLGIKQVEDIYFMSDEGMTTFYPSTKQKKRYYSAAEVLYGIT